MSETASKPLQPLKPLSIERVREYFDAQGWKYEDGSSPQSIRTGFAGMGLEVAYFAPNLAVTTSVAVDAITADRYEEVLAWAESYNNANAFPSVSAVRDPQRNLAALGAVYSMPGFWEYTDTQFAAHLSSGIEGVLNASRDFLSHFAPEVLARIDENAGRS